MHQTTVTEMFAPTAFPSARKSRLTSMGLTAAVLCLTAASQLGAQDAKKSRPVFYEVGNGVFAAPQISGLDQLRLAGTAFQFQMPRQPIRQAGQERA